MAQILSIDDSRATRSFIRNVVEILGHDLIEATDGQDGLDVLEREKGIELILLDWNMPVMNGLQMLEIIIADKRFKNIPVIMVSSETECSKLVEAINCGAKDYIIKPFSQDDLKIKISEYLESNINKCLDSSRQCNSLLI